jgi:radical SAM protein with 4Fe4S-binding SPASM domain
MGVFRAHLTNYYRTHYRHDEQWFLTPAQMGELNRTVRRLQSELPWPELKCNAGSRDFSMPGKNSRKEWDNRSRCSGGFSSCVVLPNGDVVLCEQMPHSAEFVVGNVRQHGLMEVWNSERLLDFVVPPREKFGSTPCAGCGEFDVCHRIYGRCFRDAYFNYGTPFAPSPNCPQASPGLRMS